MIRNLLVLAVIVIAFVVGMKIGGNKPGPVPVPGETQAVPQEPENKLISNIREAVDEKIAKPIGKKTRLSLNLAREMGVRAASIKIQKKGDTIVLSGSVPYEEQKTLAGKLAAEYGDASTVKNNIEVHPASEKPKETPSASLSASPLQEPTPDAGKTGSEEQKETKD
ncbi:MAG: BON domain-containing protein [Chloroflexi bacterium]|nr:BON domain-containing protein [Chloroflexota bacterium]